MGWLTEIRRRRAQRQAYEALQRDAPAALARALAQGARDVPGDLAHETLLAAALSQQSPACVTVLLEAGADPAAIDALGDCPAQRAATAAVMAHERAAKPWAVPPDQRTGDASAAWARARAIIEAIVLHAPQAIFAPSHEPQFLATRPDGISGCAAMRLLHDPIFTALIEAAVRARPDDFVRHEVHAQDTRVTSLLEGALLIGNTHLLRVFASLLPPRLQKLPGERGMPALELAIKRGDVHAVEALCAVRALYTEDPSLSRRRCSPLMLTVQCLVLAHPDEARKWVTIAEALLAAGADPHRVDPVTGMSPSDHLSASLRSAAPSLHAETLLATFRASALRPGAPAGEGAPSADGASHSPEL